MKLGFIGVGNMGGPMCRNLIKNSGLETPEIFSYVHCVMSVLRA